MQQETIAAIATPPGTGGIGIIRISGPLVRPILDARFVSSSSSFRDFHPWTLHHGFVLDAKGRRLDDVLAVFMPGPRTFTGEDVAEWHCHGGPVLLGEILESLLEAGARLAAPGEFARRAFLNGRLDLTQAEAIAEMISAPSREGARLAAARLDGLLGKRMEELREKIDGLRAQLCLAVDFPEEEVECLSRQELLAGVDAVDKAAASLIAAFERTRCWREGVVVALAGAVNAGKSSLMNALLGRERALVTEHPGTTRDFLEESVMLDGLPVRLVDTAGLRDTDDVDPVEAQGIRLGQEKIAEADVVLLLFDGSHATGSAFPAELAKVAAELARKGLSDRVILVWNKCDLAMPPAGWEQKWLSGWRNATGKMASNSNMDLHTGPQVTTVSARTGEGLEQLAAVARRVAVAASQGGEHADELVPNLRQALALRRVREELAPLANEAASGIPYDLCAVRLDGAAAILSEIIGLQTPDEILNRIFASFCIGK